MKHYRHFFQLLKGLFLHLIIYYLLRLEFTEVSCFFEVDRWHFPKNLSQSSIQGRSRSNYCTLTALTIIAKLFYTFPLQSVDPIAPLNSTVAMLSYWFLTAVI